MLEKTYNVQERDALESVMTLIDSISRSIEVSSKTKSNKIAMAATYRRLVRGTKLEDDRKKFEDLLQPQRRLLRVANVDAAKVTLTDGEDEVDNPVVLLFSDTIIVAEANVEKGVAEGEEDLKCVPSPAPARHGMATKSMHPEA